MGCSGCNNKIDGKPAGCKSNGHCASGGCEKKDVFDWLNLQGIAELDGNTYPFVEVRFKNGRKGIFENKKNLSLLSGDMVVVDVPNGHHLGKVSLQGDLVRLQIKKKKVKTSEIPEIYRIANQKDIERFNESKNRESGSLFRTREIIQELGLKMKLSDVEFQGDGNKAIFYYSAEDRVDFRELIKRIAGEFKIRVEMKQVSLRYEASYLGGIGSCGRELCCSTWLSEFKSVNTSSARYQSLAINPSKLSGQCGRLKCCLNYELDTYIEALGHIPKIEKPLKTEKGEAYLQKTDIFRKIMYFGYKKENNWHSVSVKRVVQIQKLNENGKVPFSLASDREEKNDQKLPNSKVESRDLDALDKKLSKKPKKKKKYRKNRNKRRGSQQ